jgi:hypothetical protein
LTDFLLARIAEDERDADDMWAEDYPSDPEPGTWWKWVRAECEAKRRIVEDFEILHRDYQVTHDPTTEARRFQARIAVARLATIYADHPDFDESWRP